MNAYIVILALVASASAGHLYGGPTVLAAGPAVATYAAPAFATTYNAAPVYAAHAPVVKTFAAPAVYAAPAPIVKTFATPAVYAAPAPVVRAYNYGYQVAPAVYGGPVLAGPAYAAPAYAPYAAAPAFAPYASPYGAPVIAKTIL